MKVKNLFIENDNGSGKIYFMADLHINHENVLKFGSRPFYNTEKMLEYIEQEFQKLTPQDILFDLGDTFWSMEPNNCINILKKIPCPIYKIMGNHDKYGLYIIGNKTLEPYYKLIVDLLDIRVEYKKKIYFCTLSHYPLVSWNHKPYGSINIHGHCHGNIDEFNNNSPDLRIDVGFDSYISKLNGSFLIPFSKVYESMIEKTGGLEFDKWVISNCKTL